MRVREKGAAGLWILWTTARAGSSSVPAVARSHRPTAMQALAIQDARSGRRRPTGAGAGTTPGTTERASLGILHPRRRRLTGP